MSSGIPVSNINNLNIVTFIKDIYLSLKHIDQSFNTMKTEIDTRLGKLEDQHQTILERLNNLEYLISSMNTKLMESETMDKNIESELLDKMYMLNKVNEKDSKIDLKPKELTISNILENGYTMLDVNNTLHNSNNLENNLMLAEYQPLDLSSDISFDLQSQIIDRYPLTVQRFLKSSLSGYSDSGENLKVSTCITSPTDMCLNTYNRLKDNDDKISETKKKTKEKQGLDSLLFG
jgi:hypothetical protein